MRKIFLSDVFILGQNISWIRDFTISKHQIILRGKNHDGIGLFEVLSEMIDVMKELAIEEITILEISKFKEIMIKKKYLGIGNLDFEDHELLKKRIDIWADRLTGEFLKQNSLVVSNSRLLETTTLLQGAISLFDPPIWDEINESAKSDLNEAVECIIYKLPTSAGIMSLRATESVLRLYFKKLTNEEFNGRDAWGDLLNKIRSKDVNKGLINHLDYIRSNLRNKLFHPEDVLSQEEAERLLPTVITVITEMIKQIIKLNSLI